MQASPFATYKQQIRNCNVCFGSETSRICGKILSIAMIVEEACNISLAAAARLCRDLGQTLAHPAVKR